MKYTKIFRVLTLAVILPLLLMVIPVNPAHAVYYDEYIFVSPASGEIGDTITVDGEGFDPSSEGVDIYVKLYFSPDEADPGDDIDHEVTTYKYVGTSPRIDSSGEFSNKTFRVPSTLPEGDEDVHGGTYYIYATYITKRIVAVDSFTVLAAEISIDTDDGPVGTEVGISGEDFGSRDDITVEYDGRSLSDDCLFDCENEKTSSSGEFTCAILIPESIAGDHTITVRDEAGSEDEAVFTVEPEIVIDPVSGSPGTKITVNGTGFGYKKGVTITFDNAGVTTTPSSVETDSDGSFEATFNVAVTEAGTYDIEAEDEDDNLASAVFTIAVSFAVSPTTGNVGTVITVSGTGFGAGKTMTIAYDGTPVTEATATVNTDGTFSTTFNAPASIHGGHTITATDGTTTMASTFTMESTAPPIPAPLLPEMDVKAKSQAYFDWEDVDDPSGVTYTLQIATDEDFASDAMVLEQEGLSDSEYTLTKEERLESTKKGEPYYWRVKAIDGASNESDWSGAGSFYVGFSWPGWMVHLWWGLGVLGAIFLGLWLGKRRAYYY